MFNLPFFQDRLKELAEEYKAFAQVRNEQQRAVVEKATADYKLYAAEYAKLQPLAAKAQQKEPLSSEEIERVNKTRQAGKSLYARLSPHAHIELIKKMVGAVLKNSKTLASLQKYAAQQPKNSPPPAKQEKESAPAPKFNMFLPADIQATMNEIHRVQTRIQQLQKELGF